MVTGFAGCHGEREDRMTHTNKRLDSSASATPSWDSMSTAHGGARPMAGEFEIDFVDQPKIINIDGNFGIVNLLDRLDYFFARDHGGLIA